MTKETGGTATKSTAKESNHQEKLDWTQVPTGGVIEGAGNSVEYQTGDWRSERPVIDFSKCIQCLFCWVYCPDGAIKTENQKVVGVDYYHCKGCGICSTECPAKCIKMIDELSALKEESASTAKADGEAKSESSGKGVR
ncbi:MAG: 4Fe-4S binding protein [Chloroflexi bacterium]|nr:4Fe-4S binding protein [Chloroflexota bacterium]